MTKAELEKIIEDIVDWMNYQTPEVAEDLIYHCFPEKAQEYFGLNEDVEPETEDKKELDWSELDDEEFLYTIAQDAGLSKYDYESLMDDYRNLRADEWLDAFKDDLDEDALTEFKRRFCHEDEEEEEE